MNHGARVLSKGRVQAIAAVAFGPARAVVVAAAALPCADWLLDPDCGEDEKLCNAGGVAAVDVEDVLVADAPATAACVFRADALGAVEFCTCDSNW